MVATGIGIALCFIAVVVAIIRKASITSARNNLNATLSHSPKSHLSKSTASLTGGEDEATEVRETQLGTLEDMAGFEKKPTCVGTSKVLFPTDEPTKFATMGSNRHAEGGSSSSRFVSETNLSEHQLMLPKSEKFFVERQSPDGRKDERFDETSPRSEASPYTRKSEAWMDFINDELTSTSPREVLLAEINSR